MVYWINGPYGVGKSTVAEVLQKELPKAHIFDAEEVGNAIRDNFPEESKYSIIFEGYSLWRETNYKLLKEIYERYDGDIIVPMTLTLPESYEEIIKCLMDSDIKVKYVILDADYMTIHDRIIAGERKRDAGACRISTCAWRRCKMIGMQFISIPATSRQNRLQRKLLESQKSPL